MHIPRFWAEGRARHRDGTRQRTVRRFGWSNASPADAQAMADERAADALARLLAGESVAAREPKLPYNGADGLPIREEILAEHGTTVLTRNAYGAVCLNTPNVLFVDMDAHPTDASSIGCVIGCAVLLVAVAVGVWWSVWPGVAVAVIGVLLLDRVFTRFNRWRLDRYQTVWAGRARERVAAFADARPGWHLRLYETPAGFRVLAMHRTFDPADPEVADCFRELGADPRYVAMCVTQHCFRARVSPKPWRIGLDKHIRPRPGVWPINPARLPDRQAWVARYEEAARDFASCRFVDSFGTGPTDPAAAGVQRLHDDLCRAASDLPIA